MEGDLSKQLSKKKMLLRELYVWEEEGLDGLRLKKREEVKNLAVKDIVAGVVVVHDDGGDDDGLLPRT
jgi:hypothetical protein